MSSDVPKPDELASSGSDLPAGERLAALRIVDANANRAAEGLRVVEEYCRFYLDDRFLARELKQMRHELAELLQPISPSLLAAARDTVADVGTAISTDQEQSRTSLLAVAAASTKRVEQALRAIEEYAKALGLPQAVGFEQLRYRAYSLGKAWTLVDASRRRLADARLYVLIDGRESETAFAELVEKLIRARIDVLQLRDKTLDDRSLLGRARLLRQLVSRDETYPLFIVNDRPDIALLAGADGVHVGQEELTVRDVRKVVGPEMLVGVSTHSIEQARQAVIDGANYIGCGPTFPSQTKQFAEFAGLEYLKQVAGEIGLPAFAIGGITQSNLSEVIGTGFIRVAVGSSITSAPDAEEEARLMLHQLARAAEQMPAGLRRSAER